MTPLAAMQASGLFVLLALMLIIRRSCAFLLFEPYSFDRHEVLPGIRDRRSMLPPFPPMATLNHVPMPYWLRDDMGGGPKSLRFAKRSSPAFGHKFGHPHDKMMKRRIKFGFVKASKPYVGDPRFQMDPTRSYNTERYASSSRPPQRYNPFANYFGFRPKRIIQPPLPFFQVYVPPNTYGGNAYGTSNGGFNTFAQLGEPETHEERPTLKLPLRKPLA